MTITTPCPGMLDNAIILIQVLINIIMISIGPEAATSYFVYHFLRFHNALAVSVT